LDGTRGILIVGKVTLENSDGYPDNNVKEASSVEASGRLARIDLFKASAG
jgi:hypothetical protein